MYPGIFIAIVVVAVVVWKDKVLPPTGDFAQWGSGGI